MPAPSRYIRPDVEELGDAIGVPRFNTSDSSIWSQTINGLTFQGGLASGAGAVSFEVPFPTQVLGVFMNGATASAISTTGFTASAGGYWMAVGL